LHQDSGKLLQRVPTLKFLGIVDNNLNAKHDGGARRTGARA
jgi:hypothetical protein